MTTSKQHWLSIEGIVCDVERVDGSGMDFGHFHIVYEYEVAGTKHQGAFKHYVSEELDVLHSHDTITILYDPVHPERSCYPDAVGAGQLRLMVGVGVVVALVVLGIVGYGLNLMLARL